MSKLKIPLKNLIGKATGSDRETIKGKLIYGIFWNLISALASQVFPMVAAIFTARFLGTFAYGQLGMINSTVILFSTFAGLGLGITATKYIAQLHKTEPERTGRIMGLTNLMGLVSGVVMFLVLFALAPWLAANTLSAPDLVPVLRVASLLLIFNTLMGIQSGSIAGFGAFRDLARIALIQGIVSATLTVTGVYFFGLTGAVTALVINSVINLALYKVTLNNLVKSFKIRIEYLKSWRERDVVWKLSLPAMLSGVMIGPVVWIANVIIINTPSGYAQLGLFNAADQWRTVLTFLPAVIGGVLLPLVSAHINEENKALETVNVLASWVMVIIIALPLIAFPEVLALFYGQDYFSTIFLESLALMMFVSCIIAYKEGIARKLVAKNLMWWGFLNNLTWGTCFLISVFILKNLGALGLALAYLISYITVTVLFVPFYISRRVVPKDLLISKEVFLAWTVLAVQTIATVLGASILIRTTILLISIIVLIFAFYSMLKKNKIA